MSDDNVIPVRDEDGEVRFWYKLRPAFWVDVENRRRHRWSLRKTPTYVYYYDGKEIDPR